MSDGQRMNTNVLNRGRFAGADRFDGRFSAVEEAPAGSRSPSAAAIFPGLMFPRSMFPKVDVPKVLGMMFSGPLRRNACHAAAAMKRNPEKTSMNRQAADPPGYDFRLYIAGQAPRSIAAVCNLRKLCETYLSGRYRLDVIDLMEEPARAQCDRIIAVPTLVRHWPGAVTRIVGDLSNSECVLTRLDIDISPKDITPKDSTHRTRRR
jgi:circadian clock protein KaiB